MRRAIYKGVVVGVLILGIAYFWHEQGELYMAVLRHIPQILFEGYQPAAECLLAVFLLPSGRKRRKWEKDDDEDED